MHTAAVVIPDLFWWRKNQIATANTNKPSIPAAKSWLG